jgi:hypothetical protein
MSPFTYFPVALYTRPADEGASPGDDDNDGLPPGSGAATLPGEESFMEVTLTERMPRSGVDTAARTRSFPYLGIKLATKSELVVRLSEATLWRCAHLWNRIGNAIGSALGSDSGPDPGEPGAARRSSSVSAASPGVTTAMATGGRVRADMPIHVALLSLSRLALRLSIRTAPDGSAAAGAGGTGPNVIQSLGLTLANVDEAQLELQPVVLEGVHARGHAALWRLLLGHASRQLRGQVLRLLQGVDVLDNVSSALGVASAGVAALSLDPTFTARRRGALGGDARPRVATIGDGLRDGGEALARSLLRGVTGLLTKPVEGARREGVEGFIKGVGKGLLGAATQPMSGVLDLVSSTTAGLSASWDTVAAVLSDERTHTRRRLPRAVRGDGVLRPYEGYQAVGQHILRLATASSGGSGSALGLDVFLRARGAARTDIYEGHVADLPGRRIAMVTNRRLMVLVRPEEEHDLLEDPCTALWHAEWRDILAVELHRLRGEPPSALPSVLVVHLKRTAARGGALGSGGSRFTAFDGDPSRQLRRMVRCSPGTSQAVQLARLIATARERATGDGGGSGGAAALPGLLPRVSSTSASLDADGGRGGWAFSQSGSLGDLLGRGGSQTGGLGYDYDVDTVPDDLPDDDPGGGGGGFDLEALALGTGDADSALREGAEDDDLNADDDVDVGDASSVVLAAMAPPPASPAATPTRARRDSASASGPPPGGAAASTAHHFGATASGPASPGDPTTGPPALPCTGFSRLWCSRGAEGDTFRPVSLWRPLAPQGYITLGDVAQTGYDPPMSPVAVYRADDPALAPPLGFVLVWRDTGSGAQERVTLWAPQPPPGYAALGCVAVAGDAQPGPDAVRCVALERVRSPPHRIADSL